jgi:myo-inositol-1(or 4)-monophosphatase
MASPLLTVMSNAARRAARAIRRDFGEVENLQVSLKGPANFVTRTDKRVEEMLAEDLRKARPGFGFLMEESGTRAGSDKEHRWIVDPIDGTTNFIHGIAHFAISIALERAGEIIAGLVYNPISDEMFSAERGRGAFLNDRRRLRVAARRSLTEAVIACGIPHHGRGDHEQFGIEMARVQATAAGLRRFGAASLDLCWVAAGRVDAYWERGLAPWDIAAGLLIVREAGGTVGDVDGAADVLETGNVLAGNDELYRQLQAELAGAATQAPPAADKTA